MAKKKIKNYNEILYELQKQAVINKTGATDDQIKKQAAQKTTQSLSNAYVREARPTKTTNTTKKTKTTTTNTTKKSSDGLFSAFDDGYDFGDVSKTILKGGKMFLEGPVKVGKGLLKDPLQTIKSTGIGFAEGFDKANENVTNAVSDIIDWVTPDSWKKESKLSFKTSDLNKIASTATDEEKQEILKEIEDKYGKDSAMYESTRIMFNTTNEDKSILGKKYYDTDTFDKKLAGELSDEQLEIYGVGENLGGMAYDYSLGYMTGGLLNPGSTKAFEIASKGSLFLRSQQQATEQAIAEGYDEGKARLFGVTVGGFETGLESVGFDEYGGLGKLAKENLLRIAGGEAIEEFLMPYLEHGARSVYFGEEYDLEGASEEALKGAGLGALTGVIMSAGGRGYAKTDSVIDKISNGKEVTDSEIVAAAKEIEANNPGTIENAINQGTEALKQDIETESETQKNINAQIQDLESQLDTSMNAEQQKQVMDQIEVLKGQYEAETQNIAKQKQEQENAEKELRRSNFTYDTTKITDEFERNVYESATKYLNNTDRSHEFVDIVAKISKDKGTRYSFINNEGLKSSGLNIEGKQVNGLVRTEQDGKPTILINIDSTKALNTIVGHETTHLLEGTQEYQQLQKTIFEYAESKGELETIRNELTELYKDIENADIDSEITAELVGDYLFTDSEFINSLAIEKPTLFQKIKDLIDDLVVRFRGTKEERQLRKVQKAFRNAYSVSDSNNVDTKYSINDNQGRTLTKEQQEYFKDSKVRDSEGNLEIVYHSTPKQFTIFDTSKLGENTGYGNTDLGMFVTTNKEFSQRFKDIDNKGKQGTTMELYANVTNPIIHPYNAYEKYDYNELDKILTDYLEATNNKDGLNYLNEMVEDGEAKSIYEAYQIIAQDSDPFENAANERKILEEKGYDAVEIVEGIESQLIDGNYGTNPISSYAIFNSNQIKNIDNTNPTSDADIRYSLSTKKDSDGNDLTIGQQKRFKNSKAVDKNGNLKVLYHGTTEEFTVFEGGIFLTDDYWNADGYASGERVMEVYANIERPLILDCEGRKWDDLDFELGTSTREVVSNFDRDKYDGVIFENINDNWIDDEAGEIGTVYYVDDSNQVKDIYNENPTDNPDIRYSLTPEYGMQHRPSTDYGDASNFEENMPDVFEHPEWYMFGGDDWYKKSYRESLNALRKVRNNPDGEITIYRATVGDTFNEGDWVSPSKTYAEWHNYSNLDGKGKVIELKVKAKDIRFAGDDLNEFGYFPNGVDEYSLSKFNEQRAEAKGNYNVYGDEVKLQVEEAIAPLQEKIEALSEQLNTAMDSSEVKYTQPTKAELDHLEQTRLNKSGSEYALEFYGLRDKYGQVKLYKGIEEYKHSPDTYEAPTENPMGQALTEADLDEFYNQSSEEFNRITDEDAPMPMEDTTPDYDYEMPEVESPFEDRNIEDMGNRKVKAYQYEHPEVRPYFKEAAQGMLYDLNNTIKGERLYNDEAYYNTNGEAGWTGVTRQTTADIADLLDNYHHTYADIEKGLKAIIEDHGAENIAVAKRIEFALDERLRNGYTAVDGLEIPANQEYIDLLREKEFNNFYDSLPNNDIAPIEQSLEQDSVIAPETKNVAKNIPETAYEAITPKQSNEPKMKRVKDDLGYIPKNPTKESSYDMPSRPVKTETNKSTRPIKSTKSSTWNTLKYLFTNRNEAIDRYAKATGNNNIKFLADHLNNIQGEITTNINNAQIDNEGNVIGKGIVDIFNQAREAKLEAAFDDYLFHLSNKARHKQGKGSLVPYNESKALTIEYEKAYPEMKKWAREVNKYNKNTLYKQVQAGLYTREFADSLTKMYEFYVPFYEDVERMYVPGEKGAIKARGTVRLAEGGANRNLLNFEEAMARQTDTAIRAIRKNLLYQEIVNSSYNKTMLATGEDNAGLYADANGYYVTAKEGGYNIAANIGEDLYRGLDNQLEHQIREYEQKLSKITKPLQKLSDIKRKIHTTWSPTFIVKNPLKDIQDAPLNSKYAKDWAINYPKALEELTTGQGEQLQQFLNMYGEAGVMGDYVIDSGLHDITKSVKVKKKLKGIAKLNEIMELAPRYAEYLASLKNGTSQMEALYNAREVTTNFGRGGVITKALNRNGFTFLNASVQGFSKLIRNFSGENGAKGVVNASLKAVMYGILPSLFNALAFDDDEEYEALPDYIKDNYYLFKTDDGEFIRIPKGRMISIFGSAARRALEASQGEEDAFDGYLTNAYSQVGVQNPLENNIFAPIIQAYGSENGKTWYGSDLVPTRLQDVPEAEQYDESTDIFSKWLGETFGISPYKVNYIFDQYTGGIGDLLLPLITPEANSDGSFLAPIKDQFTANSTMDNKYAGEFYTKRDELEVKSNSMYATEEDQLMYEYMNQVSWDMSSLYKEKREVQNSDLTKAEKYERVKEIQDEINEMARNALETYNTGTYLDNYTSIGDYEFYKDIGEDKEAEWRTVYDYKAEDLAELGMTDEEKNEYFGLKQEFNDINNEYYKNKDGLENKYNKHSDEFEDESDELYMEKKNKIIDGIMGSSLTDEAKAYLYKEYYNSSAIDTITMSDIPVDYILDYQKNSFRADYDSEGKAIRNSRKDKVIDYVNEYDLSIAEKAIIIKSTNTFKFNDYNDEIVSYVADLDISEDDKVYILEELGMTVDDEGFAHWRD